VLTTPLPPPPKSHEEQKFDPEELISLWEENKKLFAVDTNESGTSKSLDSSLYKRKTPGVFWQVVIYFRRCALELMRDLRTLAIEFGAQVIAGEVEVSINVHNMHRSWNGSLWHHKRICYSTHFTCTCPNMSTYHSRPMYQ
jgi:hypothetical protein